MDKKTKITLILISIVMIVVAIIIVLTKSVPPTTSTNNTNKFDDTTVDSLRFTNANLVGNELTVLVQNTTSNEYTLNNITVKFIDSNNNVLESIDTYIGNSFNANEIRNLDVKTDADLSKTNKVEYIINR